MTFRILAAGAESDQLSCSDPSIPSDHRNLVIKVSLCLTSLAQLHRSRHTVTRLREACDIDVHIRGRAQEITNDPQCLCKPPESVGLERYWHATVAVCVATSLKGSRTHSTAQDSKPSQHHIKASEAGALLHLQRMTMPRWSPHAAPTQ